MYLSPALIRSYTVCTICMYDYVYKYLFVLQDQCYTIVNYVVFNCSPVKDTVVVNDRWGSGDPCKNGGYFTCHDRYNPGNSTPL